MDPASGHTVDVISCPVVKTGLTSMDGKLVQVAGLKRDLRTIDPRTHEVLDERPNPRPGKELCGIEAGPHGVWLGYEDVGVLDLCSRADLSIVESIAVSGRIAGVSANEQFVIYADHQAATITLVDLARREEVTVIEVEGNPTGTTWDGERIWYCDYSTAALRSIQLPDLVRT